MLLYSMFNILISSILFWEMILFMIVCLQRGLTCIWCPHPIWTFMASARCRSRRRTFTSGTSITPELNWSCGLWVHCDGTDATLHALLSSLEGKCFRFSILHEYFVYFIIKSRIKKYQFCARSRKDILSCLLQWLCSPYIYLFIYWCHGLEPEG